MKKIVIIPNTTKDIGFKYTNALTKILSQYDCTYEVSLDEKEDFAYPDVQADLYIVLGGDGSIMRASHNAALRGIPILGVNLGRVGYMAELETNELDMIGRFFTGEYSIEERMMLTVTSPGEQSHIALNDVVISNGSISKIVTLSLFSNGKFVSNYNSDGIIVATPTGSTAYSMSAGGPVVDPFLDCFVVTPVCPHTLSSRPIVFSSNNVLEIKNETDRDIPVFLTIDGGDNLKIKNGERIKIERSVKNVKLLRIKNEDFYSTLGKKMN